MPEHRFNENSKNNKLINCLISWPVPSLPPAPPAVVMTDLIERMVDQSLLLLLLQGVAMRMSHSRWRRRCWTCSHCSRQCHCYSKSSLSIQYSRLSFLIKNIFCSCICIYTAATMYTLNTPTYFVFPLCSWIFFMPGEKKERKERRKEKLCYEITYFVTVQSERKRERKRAFCYIEKKIIFFLSLKWAYLAQFSNSFQWGIWRALRIWKKR